MQTEDDESWHELYNQAFPGIPPEKLIAQRSNVSSIHYWAIARGAGIGMLPTYVYAVGAPIIPLNLPVHHNIDIWMTYHESASSIPRVRKLCDWLIEVFSPKTYPWFRDEYIAPDELKKMYRGKALINPLELASKDNLEIAPHSKTKHRR